MPMLGWLVLGSIVSFNSKSELIVPQLLFVISYLLTYFLVRDRVLANPKAFFVNGEPSGTLSLHYSYYVYALTEFGLVVMLLFIADNDKLRQGRKLVAGVLALIGILLPGLFDSYNFLLVCANYEKCYATANSAIDLHFAISLCELTIASAAGLAMVFLVSFIVSDGVLKNLFGDVRDRVMCEVLCDSCKLLSDKNLPTK